MKYYYPFDTRDDPPLSEVGGKGQSLLQSTRAGFDVPAGFVLTVSFFEPWLVHVQSTEEWRTFVESAVGAEKSERKKKDDDRGGEDHVRDDGQEEGEAEEASEIRTLCDAVKERCSELEFNATQRQELDGALRSCFGVGEERGEGESPERQDSPANEIVVVAVRSSSPEEDLTGTSFAGGYETTLGVAASSSSDLLEAVLTSFTSMFDHRVVTYKARNGMPLDDPRIAVVVQRQVASEVSGVAFSINPGNNCYDESVISAYYGLGESVVSGTVTPDTYVVDKVSRRVISRSTAEDGVNKEEKGGGGGTGAKQTKEKERERRRSRRRPVLTDDQILRVSDLASEVERKMGRPADVEWAIESGDGGAKGEEQQLRLLQARPVTAYVPLFPEMLTDPGRETKKNLYLDLIVLTQGFSDSMSVLGLDLWAKFFETMKPHMTHGKDGFIWDIHGREYIHVSHILGSMGGRSVVTKMWTTFDANMRRTLESVDLDEYVPSSVPPRSKYLMLRMAKRLFQTMPSMVRGMWNYEKSMDEYLELTEELMEKCRYKEKNGTLDEKSFGTDVEDLMESFGEMIYKIGSIVMPYWSRWKLHRLFGDDPEMKNSLVCLQMDLDGNPTSEMGHRMLALASFPEVAECGDGAEFERRLKKGGGGEADDDGDGGGDGCGVSAEFREAYDDYMDKFGCRGMKEIDVASPRTSDDVEHFFDRLKRIDVNDNAIKTVRERKEAAYAKLLEKATALGKADKFEYHAGIIQRLGGYREHPKYLYVYMVAYLRRRALSLGNKFVEEGRLERPEQIFDLTVEQIASANDGDADPLLESARRNVAPYEDTKHVRDWPKLVDSRGRILRAPRGGAAGEEEDGAVLAGDPISAGVAKGRAKVLRTGPYEKTLARGEILVARASEPSWTPVFINAAGVVMEVGGPLQHGAIIAREYGIPCVSGIEKATEEIRDGDLIEVDGTSGTVKRVKE